MNVLAGIQIVEATDPDGRFIIDDGRHIASTLRDLFVNWQSSKDIDANGNEWDPKLLDIFERGLTVHKVKYEDDTNRDYRQIWQAARHDESNNKVRYTSIFLIHEIGRKATLLHDGNKHRANAYLVGVYGSSNQSLVYRWLRVAEGIKSDAIVAKLKDLPYLKQVYILSNNFFVGVGPSAREKLSEKYALAALEVLESEHSEDTTSCSMSSTTFTSACRSFKLLERWERHILKQFGAIAEQSPAVHRILASLRSKSGAQQIESCASQGLPLHGHSAENPGIIECFVLVTTLQNCLAGGLHPPQSVDVMSTMKAQAQWVDSCATTDAYALQASSMDDAKREKEEAYAVDEAMLLSMSHPGDIERTEEEVILQRAKESLAYIESFDVEEALLCRCLQFEGMKSFVIIDMRTSKKAAVARMIDLAKKVVAKMSAPRTANISVVGESRFDLYVDVRTQLVNNFPTRRVTSLHMTRGRIHNNVNAPVYCFAALPQGATPEGLLASVTYGRAKPVEQVRARCMERTCPLRSPKDRLGLGPSPRDADEEIPMEDRPDDGDALTQMLSEEDEYVAA